MHQALRYFVLAVAMHPSAFGQGSSVATPTVQQPLHQVASTNSDTAWRPSPSQRETVETLTKEYFSLRDTNKAEAAYELLSERQKQHQPFPTFSRKLREFNESSGDAQGRTLRKVTWYKDTPQAGPGLYVAVDFYSKYSGLALHCGYVVWHEQPNGSFLQVSEVTNIIPNAAIPAIKPEQMASIRAQFRC